MRTTPALLCLALAALVGCDGGPFDQPETPCDSRSAWWPDADGDGVADSDEVYLTCEDPGEGWTDAPWEDSDTDGSG